MQHCFEQQGTENTWLMAKGYIRESPCGSWSWIGTFSILVFESFVLCPGLCVPEQVQVPDGETQPMQTPPEPVPVKEAAEERKVRVKRGIINIDTLSRNFQPNEVVTLEAVRARKLVAKDVDYLKVLARGYIDKPLIVEAHDFSMDAVKMILLTGGRAIRKKK